MSTDAAPSELELKLAVDGEHALAAIARALGAPLPAPAIQVNHFFDTPGRALRERGCALRLRDEDGAFTLTLKGPRRPGRDAALAERAEEEVSIGAGEAAAVLAGTVSPLELLCRRAARAPLADRVRAELGDETVGRLGAFRNERRRIGPVRCPTDGGAVELLFELDRTELPGGRVDCEVEVEVSHADADRARAAVAAVLERANVTGRPTTSKARRFFEALEADGA